MFPTIERRGFTLIELLVVIAIIGVLSSFVMSSLNGARSKSRDTKRVAEVRSLMIALELYRDTYGRYPVSTNCGATSPNISWCNSVQTLAAGHWIKDNGTSNVLAPYIADEPRDPRQGTTANWLPGNGGTYFYFSPTGGSSYMIVYGVENYPHIQETLDGIVTCTGQSFHYGSGSNGIITIGRSCN
jgi:prepilin-type N-terminal cleavage/methylation domain-containing protein